MCSILPKILPSHSLSSQPVLTTCYRCKCFYPTQLVGKCHTRTRLSKFPYADHPQNSALCGGMKKWVTENVYSLVLHMTFSEDKIEEHKCSISWAVLCSMVYVYLSNKQTNICIKLMGIFVSLSCFSFELLCRVGKAAYICHSRKGIVFYTVMKCEELF